ncbi:MAG: hypothetical protein WCO86_09720 [Planctomycetota bacterium]
MPKAGWRHFKLHQNSMNPVMTSRFMLTGRLETGSPVLGREMLLDIIGATVVGGTSLFGGKGKIGWTLFGVLFLTVLDNALNLLSLSQFSITMTKGAVILLASVLDAVRNRFVAGGS